MSILAFPPSWVFHTEQFALLQSTEKVQGWRQGKPQTSRRDAAIAMRDCSFFRCLFLPCGASLSVKQILKKEMI